MTLKKWNFELQWYSGMNYYCIAKNFEEALAKARKKAEQLKNEEDLEVAPDVVSISSDRGDYVE